MKLFRTLPLTRLLALIVVFVAAVTAGAIAVAARGGSGATPPAKPLANAIHDALAATEPAGITARITFTNKLFPSGALTGQAGSALMSGASGRLWANANGGRLELQSDAGDAQITWNATTITVYDASSNTAYVADLPKDTSTSPQDTGTPPTLDEITKFLTDAGAHWAISDAAPSNVAGEEAYTVSVSPKHDGGLLGSAELAWDAIHGTPLKLAVYAQGSSSPVLALEATDISFGSVSDGDISVSPPAGTKMIDLSSKSGSGVDAGAAPVTGLAAVQAAAPFTVVAPDSLVGLPLRDVRLVGPADSRSVVAVYGQGLGAIVVVERQPDPTAAKGGNALDSLPSVSLDGVTAHELSTQLGTIVSWQHGGVSFIVAGSVPTAAAEAAARALG
ncbi:MAG: LolA family protein [Gaiellaceae bacterium]